MQQANKVMLDNRKNGERIAITSADRILNGVRHNMGKVSLAKEIEKELIRCHPNREWAFTK